MELTPEQQAQYIELQKKYAAFEANREERFRERAGLSGQLRKGVDLVQESAGGAVEAVGDIFNIPQFQEYGEEVRLRNQKEAAREAPAPRSWEEDPVGTLLDYGSNTVPYLGAYAGSAATGAALGSFLGPGGAVIGGLTGLGLSSFGLGLGDIKTIQEALNPEGELEGDALLFAGAAAALDVFTGGTATQTIKRPVVEATKAAIKGKLHQEAAKQVGKNVVEGTAATIGSIAAVEVGGVVGADEVFDEERIDALTQNMMTGGLLAPLFIAPTSYASSALAARAAQKQADANKYGLIKVDEETGEVTLNQPNSLALVTPDVMKKPTAFLGLGRAVDEVNLAAQDNPVVRAFVSEFDMTFDERALNVGKPTINTEAQMLKGDFGEIADLHALKNMSKSERQAVENKIRNGVYDASSNKVRNAFRFIKEKAEEAGIKMGDLGDSYLPFMASAKAISADMGGFVREMTDAISAKRGYTEADTKKIAKLEAEVRKYAEEVTQDGAVRVADRAEIPPKLAEALEEAANGDMTKIQRPYVNIEKPGKINDNNNLERHRFLSEVDPAQLEKWEQPSDLLDKLDLYSQLTSERIAYAQRMGANNEKLNEIVRRAIVDGIERGEPLSPTAVQKMYDLANLQQRITSHEISPTHRKAVQATKSVMNTLTLPLATLSSLLELLFTLPKVGPKAMVKGGLESFRNLGAKGARLAGFKDMPRRDSERILNEMNTSFREAMVNTMARVGDDIRSQQISRYDQGFFRWNGLSAWTEFSRGWAQLAALDSFKELGSKVGDTSLSQRVRRDAAQRLMEAGLEPNEVYQWVQRGANRHEAAMGRKLKAAAIELAEDVIFNPKPVNKPTWSSNPNWYTQFFGHLKTFPLQFNNRIILPTARRLMNHQRLGSPGMQRVRDLDFQSAVTTTAMSSIALMGFTLLDGLKTFAREGNLDKYNEKTAMEKALVGLAQMGLGGMIVDSARAGSFGGSVTDVVAGPAISRTLSAAATPFALATGDKTPEEVLEDIGTSLPSFLGTREAIKDAL